MGFLNFQNYSLWIDAVIFAAAAAIVWVAGARLSRYLDTISDKTGIGKAFAGMLLLGGITSLPEVATVVTASWTGNVSLAVNNLLGTVAMNMLILAVADAVLGRDALTSTLPGPAVLLQGTLDMVMLAVAAGAIVAGDILVWGVGLWSTGLFVLFLFANWLSSKYKRRQPWTAEGEQQEGQQAQGSEIGQRSENGGRSSLSSLIVKTVIAAAAILVAGFLVAQTGDAIAGKTGMGSSIVGFVLVGMATSLPELSSVIQAVRMRQYEMAIGNIFGSNLFAIALLLLADIVYTGGDAVLNKAGRFENFALMLGIALTGVYLLGMLERRDRTVLRMGYDSLAVIVLYFAGLGMLYVIQSSGGG